MRKYTTLPYTEYTVATGNYDETRAPKVEMVILHHTNTTYQGAISWFGNPQAGTSAHYIVSNKGEIAAMLEEYYTAFHCGNYGVNQKSIGIETEWYEGMERSDILYDRVIQLVADICKYHGITPNSGTIKGHREIVATQCPGTLDIQRIISGVQKLLAPPTASVDELKRQIEDLKATEERLKREKDLVIADLKRVRQKTIQECISKLQTMM